jgi:hypothetical protein
VAVTRPILFGVDHAATPPVMEILFPDGSPALEHRVATGIRIRTAVANRDQAMVAAMRELADMTAEQLELLRETARPLDREQLAKVPRSPRPVSSMGITPVTRSPRYLGPVYCPGCAHQLGRGDNPATGYTKSCSTCGADLEIQFREDGLVIVTLRPVP